MSDDDAVNDRLREILGREPLAGDSTPDCPSPETIWDAASGTLPPDRVGSLGEHAAGCRACTAIWREATVLIRAVAPGGVEAQPPRGRPMGHAAIPWPLFAALAAMGVLAAGALCLIQQGTSPEEGAPALREAEAGSIRSLLPESVPVAREECRLRWSEGPVGARYRVQVTTVNLDLLAEGRDLGSSEFLVPAAALQGVAASDTLLWQVEAVLPDGSRVTSPTFLARMR